MSVLIKGMSMPKNCMWMDNNHEVHRCPLLDGGDNCKLQDCKEEWNWADQYAGCPLVEVKTPHGDLIDRDELFIPALSSSYDNEVVRDILDEAPVVIEAEGEI